MALAAVYGRGEIALAVHVPKPDKEAVIGAYRALNPGLRFNGSRYALDGIRYCHPPTGKRLDLPSGV